MSSGNPSKCLINSSSKVVPAGIPSIDTTHVCGVNEELLIPPGTFPTAVGGIRAPFPTFETQTGPHSYAYDITPIGPFGCEKPVTA